MLAWLTANSGIVFGVLFGLSEALAAIPAIKANSVFELLVGLLNKAMGK